MENIISEYNINFDLFFIFYTLLYFKLLYIIPHKYYTFIILLWCFCTIFDAWKLNPHLIGKHTNYTVNMIFFFFGCK